MFCVFYFIKISKFTLPGVMLIYERTSKDRKKEKFDHKVMQSKDTDENANSFKPDQTVSLLAV